MFRQFPRPESQLPSSNEQEKYVSRALAKFDSYSMPYSLSFAHFKMAIEKTSRNMPGSAEDTYDTLCTLAIAGILRYDRNTKESEQAAAVQMFQYTIRGARSLDELVGAQYPSELSQVDRNMTISFDRASATSIAYKLFKGLELYEFDLVQRAS